MKSLKLQCLILIVLLLGTSFNSLKASTDKNKHDALQLERVETNSLEYIKKMNQKVVIRKLLNQANAVVKSQSDFDNVINVASPLDQLSMGARSRFIESVVFTEKGIASFSFSDLQVELTVSEVHDILTMFGQQHLLKFLKNARIENEKDMMLLKLAEEPDHQLSWGRSSGGAIGIGDDDAIGYDCSDGKTCRVAADHICVISMCM